MKPEKSQFWSIILAGGNGKRMQPFIKKWLGKDIPKQFCSFVGERTMLQHTIERSDQLTKPEHKIIVASKSDRDLIFRQITPYPGGAVTLQPTNRETGPGIFLPLSYLRLISAEATVVIMPSDHFIYPTCGFHRTVKHAVEMVEQHPRRLLIFGVPPTIPETEYGWIQPGQPLSNGNHPSLFAIRKFVEKPSEDRAQQILTEGWMWNTMILVGKLTILWNLGWLLLPAIMQKFREFQPFIGSKWEQPMLDHIYQDMPLCNFSVDVLQQVPEHLMVVEMKNVTWSDWGQPRRIYQTIRDLGKHPNFPPTLQKEFL